jgi:hypothetical protein
MPAHLLIAVEKSSKVNRQEVAVVCMGGEDIFFGHTSLLCDLPPRTKGNPPKPLIERDYNE